MAWPTSGFPGTSGGGMVATPTRPYSPRVETGFNQALNVANGWNAPSLIQNDINANRLAGQIGYGNANYNLGVNQLNQNAALDRQRLGVEQGAIGIDRNSINRQLGVNSTLQGLANQAFGIDRRGFGIEHRGLNLNEQGVNADIADRIRKLNNDKLGLLSNKTAMGSVGSVAHRRGNQDILADQVSAWAEAQRAKSGIGLEREQLGLEGERLGVSQQRSNVEYGESGAKLRDRLKVIDNQAAKLGIDRKQLETNLQQGLAKLGVDRMFSTDDLWDAMASNDVERQGIAQQIFRDAMGMSQFFIDQQPGRASRPRVNPAVAARKPTIGGTAST